MTTAVLLLTGVGASFLFLAVLFMEGALRPGYSATYHTGSELELGLRGWIQRTSFLVMAGGMFAFAVGVDRALDARAGALLLAIFAVGMVAAGLFPPDAVRGYPPGAPTEAVDKPTWRHQAHHVISGPVAFFALMAACLVLAGQLQGAWRWYTVLTAVAGLAMTVWTAVSYQRDAAYTGLVQRGLIVIYWSWIVVIGLRLALTSS